MGKRPYHSRRKRSRERRGGAAIGPVGIGASEAGSHLAVSIGSCAPGAAGLSTWTSLIGALSRATGLSAAAASKAGIAGLVLGAVSVAGVVTLSYNSSQPAPSKPLHGGNVFRAFGAPPVSSSPGSPGAKSASLPASAQGGTAGSSLDYLANAGIARDAATGEHAEPQEPAESAGEETSGTQDAAAPEEEAEEKAAPKPKPKLLASGRLTPDGSQLTSKVALKALQDMQGTGGGFQEIYKKPGATKSYGANKRPEYGARNKTPVQSGGNAYDQAKFADRMGRKGTRMANANSAAAYASQPFDGANALGSTGEIGAGGSALGGAGTGSASAANSARSSKRIDAPPQPEAVEQPKNQTPYQMPLLAAVAALTIGMLLLKLAGDLINQAKADPTAVGAAAKLAQGKMLAMAAMMAGAAAAGLGAMIAGQYGQLAQSLPFVLGGGALAVQAGMVLAKADQAGKDAETDITGAAQQAGAVAGQALGPNQVDQSNLEPEKKKEPPKRNVDRHS